MESFGDAPDTMISTQFLGLFRIRLSIVHQPSQPTINPLERLCVTPERLLVGAEKERGDGPQTSTLGEWSHHSRD